MNYLKKAISEDNFSIKNFYAELGAATKKESDKAFRSLINTISQFQKTPKKMPLISFAKAVELAKFGVLESREAYDYWTVTNEDTNISKRVYARTSRESELLEEAFRAPKKTKTTAEDTIEEDAANISTSVSQSSNVSSNVSWGLSSIWLAWSSLIDLFLSGDLSDTDINNYSLEYLGIITLGENIGNKQSRANYPKDLLSETNKHLNSVKQDVFLAFNSTYQIFFSALEESLDICHTTLMKKSLAVKKAKDTSLTFVYECFLIFVAHTLNERGLRRISGSESAYNSRVIFRLMDGWSACRWGASIQ